MPQLQERYTEVEQQMEPLCQHHAWWFSSEGCPKVGETPHTTQLCNVQRSRRIMGIQVSTF